MQKVLLFYIGDRKIPELMEGSRKAVRSFNDGINRFEKEETREFPKKSNMAAVWVSSSGYYHKHAIVVILIVAAIITPTSDLFTLSLVSLPMWML